MILFQYFSFHSNVDGNSSGFYKLQYGVIQNHQLIMGTGCSTQAEIIENTQTPKQTKVHFDGISALNTNLVSTEDTQDSNFFDDVIHHLEYVHESQQKSTFFYNMLAHKIGELYSAVMLKMEEKILKDELTTDDFKVALSKAILLEILSMVSKLQKYKNWKTEKHKIFSKIAQGQKKIIQFFQYTYPRSKKESVPAQLDEKFQPVDDAQHTDNDFLINAGVNFDYVDIDNHGKKYVIQTIKTLINTGIKQCNRYFSTFKQTLQNEFFDGIQGSYQIGRKIPEDVSLFEGIEDNENLQIYSPEIFRFIIKWIQCIEGILLNPAKEIAKMKYLKVAEVDKDRTKFNYFSVYTSKKEIMPILIKELQDGSMKYHRLQQEHANYLADFYDNLVNVVKKENNLPQLNSNQLKTIKYGRFISKFVEFLAIQKLVYLITYLANLQKTMEEKISKGIDLISCRVNDLLRARFMGGKKQLMLILDKMQKLQSKGKLKMVRIKNRFETPLNDALINFMLIDPPNNSFLVFELQLVLKINEKQINKKQKINQKVNHVLYELQRSIFGAMAQMALLLTHKDNRMAYQKNIKLKKSSLKRLRCPQNEILEQQLQLQIPYICTLCTNFYHINQNSFPIYRCLNCNFYACPSCIFQFDPDLEFKCYSKEIIEYVHQNLNEVQDIEQNDFLFFDKKYFKIKSFNLGNKNFFDVLQDYMLENQKQYAFIYQFQEGVRYLSAYSVRSGSILPTFYQYKSRQQRKKFKLKKFDQYDIVLFLKPKIKVVQTQLKDCSLTFVYLTKIDLVNKRITEVFQFKHDKTIYAIDMGELPRQTGQISSKIKSQKIQQLKNIIDLYKPLEGRLQIDYLDLVSFNYTEKHIRNLRFAKISNNRLRDIDLLFDFSTLEEIDASRNDLLEINLRKVLIKLRVADFSENYIERVTGFTSQHLPNMKQLRLNSNNIKIFPQFELPSLLWLNLSNNEIQTLETIRENDMPKLKKLEINRNQIKLIPNIQMNELMDLEIQNNSIQDLIPLMKWKKLRNVKMAQNKIVLLPELDLQNLKELYLNNNLFCDVELLKESEMRLLRILDLSENNITELPSFQLPELRTFDISQNKLTNINNLKISQLPYLTELIVHNNKITQLCQLELDELKKLDFSYNFIVDINDFIKSKIPVLQEINLSFNKLTSLPTFQCLNLVYFNLEGNQITSFRNFRDSNLPKLNKLILNNNCIQQFLSADFTQLSQLDMNSNKLTTLDEILKDHLRNLKVFNLKMNTITKLPAMDLQSLQTLDLYDNNIVDLETFRRSEFPRLKLLNLKKNKIQQFPQMQYPFPQLQILNLKDNAIINLSKLVKCKMPQLQQLYLQNNKINQLSILTFPKLVTLFLDKNSIKSIHLLQAFNLPQINLISITQNQVEQVPLLKSSSLAQLNLSHNKIKNIEAFALSTLPKLVSLFLNNNAINGTLTQLNFPLLKTFSCTDNSIDNITVFAKSRLPKIDILRLSNNKIQILCQLYFPKLKELQLMKNQIKDIQDFCQYSQLPKLRTLNLNGNKLQTLASMKFKSLITLLLDSNQFSDIDNLVENTLPNLQKLSLKHNKITHWNQNIYLEHLYKLNLNDNFISSIETITEQNLPDLAQLKLRNNKIQSLPKQLNLSQLKELSLQGNPIFISQKDLGAYFSNWNPNLNISFNKRETDLVIMNKNGFTTQNRPQLRHNQSLT